MALASCPARHGQQWELVEDSPVLELGVCPFAGCQELRVGAVGFLRLVLPPVQDLRVRAALVTLVGEGDQAGGLQLVQDAPDVR
jgi:hypothetical protein